MATLRDKKADFTRTLLLDSAMELLRKHDIGDLGFKQIAEHAGVSERTMFRYYANRSLFLDELTTRMYARLELPAIPDSCGRILEYLAALYQQFERHPELVEVLLTSEFFSRILRTTARDRFLEIKAVLTQDYPHCPPDLILTTAANLRYIMSATSWRYYRVYFEFDAATSLRCATSLVTLSLSFLDSNAAAGVDAGE